VGTIPFSDTALATSDANGKITFTRFQQPRMLEWRQGSLSVIRSDGTVVTPGTVLPIIWKAYVGATIWGTWYNDQPSLMVQTNGPPVKVTGTNLAPSTAYQCVYTGYDSDAPPPLSPLPAPPPPPGPAQVLFNATTSALAGGGNQIGPIFPVIVGTSIGITATFNGQNGRLALQWSTDGINFGSLDTFTFDLKDANVVPSSNLNSLILPNLLPFLRILATVSNPGGATLSLLAYTGLPPIARSPLAPGGVLSSFVGAIADGADSGLLTVVPYYGDAQLMLTALVTGASPPVGAIFVVLSNASYVETYTELARFGPNIQFLAASGTTALEPPPFLKIPPQILRAQVFNRIGGGTSVTAEMVLLASGP